MKKDRDMSVSIVELFIILLGDCGTILNYIIWQFLIGTSTSTL